MTSTCEGSDQKFDVVVVGRGITGLSTALHLKAKGIGSLAICGPHPQRESVSRSSAGRILGGQADNFTRVAVAHGQGFAKDLWKFGDVAFDHLRSWCHANALPFQSGRRYRFITSAHELKEAEKAVKLLNDAGFESSFSSHNAENFGKGLKSTILAVQDDGARSAFLDAFTILDQLETVTQDIQKLDPCLGLSAGKKGALSLHLEGGKKVSTEIVVLAAHLAIPELVTSIAPAFVSVADQWSEFEIKADENITFFRPGCNFSLNNALEWGGWRKTSRLVMGGARYLRYQLGVEAKKAAVIDRLTENLKEKIKASFDVSPDVQIKKSYAALECYPCDELPIIGPLFDDWRILVASGFMGQGLTQGFYAGSCIADLILTGACDELPRRLWPERLRSLEL